MTIYSLLAVAGTVSLAFGGSYKDRSSYSADKYGHSSKKWATDKHDDYDRPSGYGNAYKYDPYERTYGKAYSYDPYERKYGKAYTVHKDDDKHYDGDHDYRSSKQWKRPSYASKDSKEWKKPSYSNKHDSKKDDYKPSSDKHGHAYSYEPYKRTYGKAYSTNDYKKDDIVKEPKVTAAPEYWKKSDYSTTDYSKSKKNDGKYGSKYSSKDKPSNYEPKGHKDHSPKDYKDEPKHKTDNHKDYSSKDEPKDNKHDMKTTREPAKYEPKDQHNEPSKYEPKGSAYSAHIGSCPSEDEFDEAAPCDYEGKCEFGEESCCGETFASKVCECADSRSFCYYTDACYGAVRFGCGGSTAEFIELDAE